MENQRTVQTDVLIIGGGNAALMAAIHASESGQKITLVDKAYAGKSGASIMASGWLNVYNKDWNGDFNILMAGIDENGSGLNDQGWSELLMSRSFEIYEELWQYGCKFPAAHDEMKEWYGKYMLITDQRAGAHDSDTANGGAPFSFIPLRHRGIPPYLRLEALRRGVTIYDRVDITELLKTDEGIVGAVGFGVRDGINYVFEAKATVLAAGNSYLHAPGWHCNEVTGDAEGMAYRAGAHITGREFGDGHFTIHKHPAWKGNGELYPAHAYFEDAHGNRLPVFGMDHGMTKAVDRGDGPCFWAFDKADETQIQALYNYSWKRGNPKETERIGLYPADKIPMQMVGGHAAGGTEEQMSGLLPKDYDCSTNLPGLYAAGDCCNTRAWGAIKNGAPWGIMPALVTGKIAGTAAAEYAKKKSGMPEQAKGQIEEFIEKQNAPIVRTSGMDPRWVIQLLQNQMIPYYVLQIKEEERLKAALQFVEFFRDRMVPKLWAHNHHELMLSHDVKNMVFTSEVFLRSSLLRKESRGRHVREDYPETNPDLNVIFEIFEKNGEMILDKVPVVHKKDYFAMLAGTDNMVI